MFYFLIQLPVPSCILLYLHNMKIIEERIVPMRVYFEEG